MDPGRSLESLLKRDRLVLVIAITAICIVAWWHLAYEAHVLYHTGVCSCAGMKMSGPDVEPWSTTTILPLFLMWAEMMVAMMLPSATPMILMFAAVNRRRREQQQPFVPTAMFVLGYIAIWTTFSAVAALAQWVLHAKALLSPAMVSTSPFLGGALLVVCGAFQWTRLKETCLTRCRSPLSFVMTDWQEGSRGALLMGLKHGTYCAGCCWALMAILFVAGVMNVWWVAAIAILVLLEKIAPMGWFRTKFSGTILILWGMWVLGSKFWLH